MGVLGLWAASMLWAGSSVAVITPAKTLVSTPLAAPPKSPKAKTVSPQASASEGAFASQAAQTTPAITAAPASEAVPVTSKPILADAFIAQTVLRVYLNRPAAISVFNARGQQIFHLDSQRPMEAVPLLGISTGFIYLTVRTAQGEMTKKLVFTGK
ncbi:MAG: hypothetical protein ABI036_08410 [Fibrobacteria bacterium]